MTGKRFWVINFLRLIHSRDHPQGTHSCETQKEQGSVPQATGTGTLSTRDDKQNGGTIPMPTFAGRPSTMSSLIPVGFPQNSVVGQQIQQISELHLREVSVSVSVSLAWEQGHGRAQADTGPQTLPDQQWSCPCLSFVISWFPSNTFLIYLFEPWRRQA